MPRGDKLGRLRKSRHQVCRSLEPNKNVACAWSSGMPWPGTGSPVYSENCCSPATSEILRRFCPPQHPASSSARRAARRVRRLDGGRPGNALKLFVNHLFAQSVKLPSSLSQYKGLVGTGPNDEIWGEHGLDRDVPWMDKYQVSVAFFGGLGFLATVYGLAVLYDPQPRLVR